MTFFLTHPAQQCSPAELQGGACWLCFGSSSLIAHLSPWTLSAEHISGRSQQTLEQAQEAIIGSAPALGQRGSLPCGCPHHHMGEVHWDPGQHSVPAVVSHRTKEHSSEVGNLVWGGTILVA